jgi:hypothetical protein
MYNTVPVKSYNLFKWKGASKSVRAQSELLFTEASMLSITNPLGSDNGLLGGFVVRNHFCYSEQNCFSFYLVLDSGTVKFEEFGFLLCFHRKVKEESGGNPKSCLNSSRS